MSVRMQSVANAHNAARRISGGGRPSIKQSGALEPLKPSSRSSSGLTISSQRVRGNAGNTDKTPELPPINPQVNRELEALKGRVAQLTEELSVSRREAESAREAAAAESTRANRAQKLADKESAARAELSAKAAETEEAASHLRAELQRLHREAAEAAAERASPAQPVVTASCSECEKLRGQLATIEEDLRRAGREREDLEQAAEGSRASVAELRDKVADLQARLDQTHAAMAQAEAGRADSDAEVAAIVADWRGRVDALESELASSRTDAEEALRHCKAQLLTSEKRAKTLSTQLEIEKEHVPDVAELDSLRDKVRRLEDAGRQRDRASAREVSQLEKRVEELTTDVRAKQSKLNKKEEELRSSIASTDREAELLQKMEAQFEDDSYEAVLLEELSEMRARFQEKLDRLTEECNDTERRCRAELRIERDGWELEKSGLESRALQLSQRCAQYDAELERLRSASAMRA